VARHYRNVGFSNEDAWYFARRVTDPYQQCEICGLPQRLLKVYEGRCFGDDNLAVFGWTHTVDHIITQAKGGPHTRENGRVLCALCNNLRGDNVRTDEQVLAVVQGRWHRNATKKDLYWLNESVGEGGIAYLGTNHAPWVLFLPQENSAFYAGYLTRRTLQGLE
jgi:hypothetical protein